MSITGFAAGFILGLIVLGIGAYVVGYLEGRRNGSDRP